MKFLVYCQTFYVTSENKRHLNYLIFFYLFMYFCCFINPIKMVFNVSLVILIVIYSRLKIGLSLVSKLTLFPVLTVEMPLSFYGTVAIKKEDYA